MAGLEEFWRNERGSSFESLALALSVIAVMFVAGADLLNYASKRDGFFARVLAGHSLDIAQHEPASVDYTTTGSIIGLRRLPALSPCTAEAK